MLFESLEERSHLAFVPAGFSDETVTTGVKQATSLAVLADGRWLVTIQSGQLRVVKNKALLPAAALNLVVDSTVERGLLGVVGDPAFATNHYIYLYYTPKHGSTTYNQVSRFTMNGDTVVAGSEKVIFTLSNVNAGNHNGGALHFGKDGKLYIATGDNVDNANAQNLGTLHGKILRINTDGTIPADNPFYTTLAGNYRAIWAYGLRNPFTFTFSSLSGDMYIDDVGGKLYEEIDVGKAGANYGWPLSEGTNNLNSKFTGPLYAYGRSVGRCIAGALFYTGSTFPAAYKNAFLYADYVAGTINYLDAATRKPHAFATGENTILDLDQSANAVIYTTHDGKIGMISYAPDSPAKILKQPASVSLAIGQPAMFIVQTGGAQPLSYQWYRNGNAITNATKDAYTIAAVAAADSGAQFTVKVTNAKLSVTSSPATLIVNKNNHAPQPVITKPVVGSTFRGGQTIQFAGSATDAEDGTLPASSFSWVIDYWTGSVRRQQGNAIFGVKSGSFIVPDMTPYKETDVKFTVTLTVTDKSGATLTTVREIKPLTSVLSVSTTLTGSPILIDGQSFVSKITFDAVEGVLRTVEVPDTLVWNNVNYKFVKWSDNGARFHTITIPSNDLNLVATYAKV